MGEISIRKRAVRFPDVRANGRAASGQLTANLPPFGLVGQLIHKVHYRNRKLEGSLFEVALYPSHEVSFQQV
jgi:hypothetical protein